MTDDIMFVKKEIESVSCHEEKEDVAKGLEEEILINDYTVKNEEWEEVKKKEGFRIKERKKMENDPRNKLKKKIHECKVNNLVENFAKKISMNNIEREPVDYSPFMDRVDTKENLNGLKIPNLLNNLFDVISIINTLAMLMIATMSIIFEEPMSHVGVTGI